MDHAILMTLWNIDFESYCYDNKNVLFYICIS